MMPEDSEARGSGPPTPVGVASDRVIRTLWVALVGVGLLLVFLDATVNYGEWASSGAIQRLFNITREDALANWFQSMQTLMVGGVLWLTVLQMKGRNHDAWTRRGWLLLAVFFTYLAVDDGAKIHERVGTAIDDISGAYEATDSSESPPGFRSYTWQVVFVPLFGAIGLFALLFLWKQLKTPALRSLLVIGLGCFAVAVGLDHVEGLEHGYDWLTARFDFDDYTVTHFAKALEEWIEMLGTTCLLIGFLTHFMRTFPVFLIRFT
jgi:hypothetical protein